MTALIEGRPHAAASGWCNRPRRPILPVQFPAPQSTPRRWAARGAGRAPVAPAEPRRNGDRCGSARSQRTLAIPPAPSPPGCNARRAPASGPCSGGSPSDAPAQRECRSDSSPSARRTAWPGVPRPCAELWWRVSGRVLARLRLAIGHFAAERETSQVLRGRARRAAGLRPGPSSRWAAGSTSSSTRFFAQDSSRPPGR